MSNFNLNQLKTKTGAEVAQALESEFSLSRTTGSGCTSSSFDNLDSDEVKTLKRKYVFESATSGDAEYQGIVSNLSGAITVTEQSLSTSGALGSSALTYTDGLIQYKIVVDGSNFSLSGSAHFTSAANKAARVSAFEIVNSSPGMKASDITSLASARSGLSLSAVNKSESRTCVDALLTGEANKTISREAGAYNIDALVSSIENSSDGAEYLADMINGAKTLGNGKTNVVNVSGTTAYVGVRRGMQALSSPDWGQELAGTSVAGQTFTINQAKAISEKSKDKIVSLVQISLLNSILE